MIEPRFSVFTVPQVSKLLQMSDDRVYRLLASGEVPGMKIGGQWRIPSSVFFQWVNGRAMWPAKVSVEGVSLDADRT